VRTILRFNFHCHHYNYIEVLFTWIQYNISLTGITINEWSTVPRTQGLVLQHLPVCNCTNLCMDVLESSESTSDAIDLQGTICFCRNVLIFSLYLKRSSKMV
jgi:hypothetical protein